MKIPSSSLTEAKMVSAKQLVRFTNTAPHAKNNYFYYSRIWKVLEKEVSY